MSIADSMLREARLLGRDRVLLAWVVIIALLSAVAVWSGLQDVSVQRSTIARLLESDRADRETVLSQQGDWGDAAYYAFHLTYDPPSPLAFAAMGQRDTAPWKHRIRMLALEGQIYESDAGNPELALISRFDFAFLAAFLLPLVLIVLLHDLHAGERTAGRHDLLAVTASRPATLWATRAALRAGAVAVAVLVPFLIGGIIGGVAGGTLLAAGGAVLVHVAFWGVLSARLAAWRQSAPVILATLVGTWLTLGVLVPAAGKVAIDWLVPLPSGAEINMTQREAVNDAWDLPKAATMEPFLVRHPEWAEYARIDRPFEWKWYYAFQQVGDQVTEPLATAYRAGRLERDRLAARVAWLSPPAKLERVLQALAGTDMREVIAYEDRIRAFHATLRAWYYPKLFRGEAYSVEALVNLPGWTPDEGAS